MVSVLSQLIERGRRWEIAQSRSFDLYGSHMQYQSLDMEHSFICPTRGVQRPEAVVHAYPKMRCLTVASGAISRPSLVVHKIRGPTWRKDYIQATVQAEPLQPILSKATAALPAMGTSACINAQPSGPVISAGRIRAVCARCTPSAQHARLQ